MKALTCNYCSDFFESPRYDTKYCGNRCRTAAHRARKKAGESKTDWLTASDPETREKFYFVRTGSDYAAKLIEIIAEMYGHNAAKLATSAAEAALQNQMIIIKE